MIDPGATLRLKFYVQYNTGTNILTPYSPLLRPEFVAQTDAYE